MGFIKRFETTGQISLISLTKLTKILTNNKEDVLEVGKKVSLSKDKYLEIINKTKEKVNKHLTKYIKA